MRVRAPALGHVRRAPGAGEGAAHARAAVRGGAVRRRLRRGEVLRHRVGHRASALNTCKPDGVVVDFQNGINDERVAAVAGRERSLGCVITISAGMYEPGHAMRTDTASHRVQDRRARRQRDTTRAARAGRAHERGGADARSRPTSGASAGRSSPSTAWPTPSPASPASARPRCAPTPRCRAVGIHLGAEAIVVGRGRRPRGGADLRASRPSASSTPTRGGGSRELLAEIADIARKRGGGRPSLLQDVIRGRRTEIDFLNGYVCEHGKQRRRQDPVQRRRRDHRARPRRRLQGRSEASRSRHRHATGVAIGAGPGGRTTPGPAPGADSVRAGGGPPCNNGARGRPHSRRGSSRLRPRRSSRARPRGSAETFVDAFRRLSRRPGRRRPRKV